MSDCEAEASGGEAVGRGKVRSSSENQRGVALHATGGADDEGAGEEPKPLETVGCGGWGGGC